MTTIHLKKAGTILFLLILCQLGFSKTKEYTLMQDSVVAEAVAIFEKTMQLSKELYTKTDEFKSMFLSHNSAIYCDYCRNESNKDRANYVLDLNAHLKKGYDFTYEIEEELVEKIETDYNTFKIVIPFSKRVNGKENTDGQFVKSVPVVHNLKATILLDFNNNRKRVVDIELFDVTVRPQLYLMARAGRMVNDINLDVVFPIAASSGTQLGAGFAYYFNPLSSFSNFQTKNYAFKVGLFVDQFKYQMSFRNFVDVQNSLSVDEGDPDQESYIDVKSEFNDLVETDDVISISIPFGLSKRWRIRDKIKWQTDISVGVQMAVSRSTLIQYQLEDEGFFYSGFNPNSAEGTSINSLTPAIFPLEESGEDFRLLDETFDFSQKSDFSVNAILQLQNGVVIERNLRSWRAGIDLSLQLSPFASDDDFEVNRFIEEDYLKYTNNSAFVFVGAYIGLTLK